MIKLYINDNKYYHENIFGLYSLKQALEASRIVGADVTTQRQILNDVARALMAFPLESSPPEMGRRIYGLVKKHVGKEDPYLKIKEKSNQFAMSIIDYGVKNTLDVKQEM